MPRLDTCLIQCTYRPEIGMDLHCEVCLQRQLAAMTANRDQQRARADAAERAELVAALNSARFVMALSSRDWGGSDKRDAWLYGIMVWWDEPAESELAERFGWTEDDVARLRTYSRAVRALLSRQQQPGGEDVVCTPCARGNHVQCGLDACTCVCPPDQTPEDEANT